MPQCAYIESIGKSRKAVNYRLRDWLISRQTLLGAPHSNWCIAKSVGVLPVPEEQLPVLLPDDVEWKPTGESPLKLHPTWRFTTCPKCGGKAERETDTMDTFMCSSWYHLRYLSPWYHKGPFDPAEYDYWMPVDNYTGGIEHANMHLIYTPFSIRHWRIWASPGVTNPCWQLRTRDCAGEESEKMSKSARQCRAPDPWFRHSGADTLRAYLMFFALGPGCAWSNSGIDGTHRCLGGGGASCWNRLSAGLPAQRLFVICCGKRTRRCGQ